VRFETEPWEQAQVYWGASASSAQTSAPTSIRHDPGWSRPVVDSP
jgi:hypothetical protein